MKSEAEITTIKSAMKIGDFSLIRRMFSATFEILKTGRRNKHATMPEKIDSYSLVETFHNPRKKYVTFGVYVNEKGEKAIGKKWGGHFKNMEHHFLKNEISAYKTINKIYSKHAKEIGEKFPEIYIPKLINVFEGKKSLMILTEKIEGQSLDYLDEAEKVKALERIISYFRFLGKKLDTKENNFISRREGWFFVFKFPLVLLQALIKSPHFAPSILKSAYKFMTLSLKIFFDKDVSLAHRDLHYGNIIVNDSKINYIDLEIMALTHWTWDLVQAISSAWQDKNFTKIFYDSQTMKEVMSNKKLYDAYKAYTLYTAIYKIAFDKFPEMDANYSYLNHALALAGNKHHE